MSKSIRSLLTALRALEEQERALHSDLCAAQLGIHPLRSGLATARNIMEGYEKRKDARPYVEAQAEFERLKLLLSAAEANIAELTRQLQEVRAAIAEITAGADRAKVFALAYRDATEQADHALAAFDEATRKHAAAMAARDQATALLARAEQDRAEALEPEIMAKARGAVTSAQAELDDAETLLANLGRWREEHRARLRTAQEQMKSAHQHAWKARAADELAVLHTHFSHVHNAYAAELASGQTSDYLWFLRRVAEDFPKPADVGAVMATLEKDFGVPARLPTFAH